MRDTMFGCMAAAAAAVGVDARRQDNNNNKKKSNGCDNCGVYGPEMPEWPTVAIRRRISAFKHLGRHPAATAVCLKWLPWA